MEQIHRIAVKLNTLKTRDPNFTIFGSSTHQYMLNAPLSFERIKKFEEENAIQLPSDYVQFLSEIGNGGAGPYYGVEPLEHALYCDLDYKNPDYLLNPKRPFPYSSAWNMEFTPTVKEVDAEEYDRQYENFTNDYWDPKHLTGVIAICNYGCATSINLVVNGAEYGNVWTDDRANFVGIYPSQELGNLGRTGFLDWYEKWLDNSLAKLPVL